MAEERFDEGERISALVDGQLHGAEFARALDDLRLRPRAAELWDRYHIVGEALRSGQSSGVHDAEFVVRLRGRLAQETPSLTPLHGAVMVAVAPVSRPAANSRWWKQVVGLASVAVAFVLVWNRPWSPEIGSVPPVAAVAQLAQMPSESSAPLVTEQAAEPVGLAINGSASTLRPPVMVRNPRLDALLAAHQQLGGASALQTPSGFLRNATFDEGAR